METNVVPCKQLKHWFASISHSPHVLHNFTMDIIVFIIDSIKEIKFTTNPVMLKAFGLRVPHSGFCLRMLPNIETKETFRVPITIE